MTHHGRYIRYILTFIVFGVNSIVGIADDHDSVLHRLTSVERTIDGLTISPASPPRPSAPRTITVAPRSTKSSTAGKGQKAQKGTSAHGKGSSAVTHRTVWTWGRVLHQGDSTIAAVISDEEWTTTLVPETHLIVGRIVDTTTSESRTLVLFIDDAGTVVSLHLKSDTLPPALSDALRDKQRGKTITMILGEARVFSETFIDDCAPFVKNIEAKLRYQPGAQPQYNVLSTAILECTTDTREIERDYSLTIDVLPDVVTVHTNED